MFRYFTGNQDQNTVQENDFCNVQHKYFKLNIPAYQDTFIIFKVILSLISKQI